VITNEHQRRQPLAARVCQHPDEPRRKVVSNKNHASISRRGSLRHIRRPCTVAKEPLPM
jgi:hypothetical protein